MTASGGVDRPASATEAREFGEQLQAEPIKRANLALRLLEAVDAGADEVRFGRSVAKAAARRRRSPTDAHPPL